MGVFTLVLGSTMLILTALAHQSVRSHRWADEQRERAAEEAQKAEEAEMAAAREAASTGAPA